MDSKEGKNFGFGGLSDLITAFKNLVIAVNTINQTLKTGLPAGNIITSLSGTNTPAGTTGAQTINKPCGSVNFAAAAGTLVVTNSLVNTGSLVIAFPLKSDASLTYATAVPASGSFMILGNAGATAETRVGFLVITVV